MKIFNSTIWQTVETRLFAQNTMLGALAKHHKKKTSGDPVRQLPKLDSGPDTGRVTYSLSPDFVRSFSTSGLPFLTFYEFNNLAGWCRDMAFAPDHVDRYASEVCQLYNVWTQKTNNTYRRHIFLDDLSAGLKISFDIPFLDTLSWFPLHICLYDDEGLYFQNEQKLVVESLSGERPNLTSWKKIPSLLDALPRLHRRSFQAD